MFLSRLSATLLLAALVVGGGPGCSPPDDSSVSATPAAPPAATQGGTEIAAKAHKPPRDASDDFFEQDAVTRLAIEVPPSELAKLRENGRAYVRGKLHEQGGALWSNVAIKLKGAAGSFREFDDKPALTLSMRKFKVKQAFHALEKFHLNNSVQDETYLHELLCSELCCAAGVPAPRVAHARVFLNGRDAGLYVLKEGFDRKFLARHFTSNEGNLYDGGFCEDIDADLERDEGKGADDHGDLHALREACQAPAIEARWKELAERLDVDAFVTFAALELMMGHWDGYCLNHNNYRLYFDPMSRQAHFFPHGMDQMFGDPGASILERPGALVASAVMQNPEWRARYRETIRRLLPLFSPPEALLKRADVIEKRLQPALHEIDPQLAIDHTQRVSELKERLIARAASLKEQVDQPDPPPPQPLAFSDEGAAELPDWEPESETEDATVESVALSNDVRCYLVRCGPSGECIASWRRKVLLARGEYRLVMSARAADILAIDDEKGNGAGLRVSGASRAGGLDGTTDWTLLEYAFGVDEEEREVVLVAELRAKRGEVCFDASSARLYRTATE
jgi:spore coat protein H